MGKPGEAIGLLQALTVVPDLGGRFAELLWRYGQVEISSSGGTLFKGHRFEPCFAHLLQTSAELQLALVVGIKERRRFASALILQPICDAVSRRCPRAWTLSRKLRKWPTEEAEKMEAGEIVGDVLAIALRPAAGFPHFQETSRQLRQRLT
mmetsp:Transcript_65767/g.122627  ORF Transcript_65767/g.122627 Transcript_65767/m.122627 type:complete len:151 (-) Transcript_65767:125-577(-)